jgi:site-specific recombinase XerC
MMHFLTYDKGLIITNGRDREGWHGARVNGNREGGYGRAAGALCSRCQGRREDRRVLHGANQEHLHTRKAYARAAGEFAAWCGEHGIVNLGQVRPVHIAAYVEGLQREMAAPSVKQRLAALRMLFDRLVVGQVIPVNPASSVRGPKDVVKKGKTPVLSVDEARALFDVIDTSSPLGLRDRALIGLMVYTFARVGAAIKMRVKDVYVQGRRTWVRLHEKGGKRHEMPCHHNLDEYLQAYIEGAQIGADAKGYLFRTALGRKSQLSERPMHQTDVYRMIRRRAKDAEVHTKIGCHSSVCGRYFFHLQILF